MSFRTQIMLILLLMMAVLLTACNTNTEPDLERDLIGSWDVIQGMDADATVQFNEDGTGSLGDESGQIPIAYEFMEDNYLTVVFVDLPAGENTFTWRVEMISRDEMHIDTDMGLKLDLKRQ